MEHGGDKRTDALRLHVRWISNLHDFGLVLQSCSFSIPNMQHELSNNNEVDIILSDFTNFSNNDNYLAYLHHQPGRLLHFE